MIDSEVVSALREASHNRSPAATARLLDSLLPEGLQQSTLAFYFRQVAPEIPLKVLIDAQAWSAIGAGSLTDEDIDRMMQPWWLNSSR